MDLDQLKLQIIYESVELAVKNYLHAENFIAYIVYKESFKGNKAMIRIIELFYHCLFGALPTY